MRRRGGGVINPFASITPGGPRGLTCVSVASVMTVALLGLSGCGAQAVLPSGSSPDAPSPTLVLKAVYELEGRQRPVIFLDAYDLPDDEFDQVMAELEVELRVDVLPAEAAFRGDPDLPALTPVDPDTGQVGVSLTLHEITEISPSEYEAIVSYARSGLDGGDVILLLQRRANRWSVVEHIVGAQS